MATLRQRVKNFLSGPDRIIALGGPSGTGKRFAAQLNGARISASSTLAKTNQSTVLVNTWPLNPILTFT